MTDAAHQPALRFLTIADTPPDLDSGASGTDMQTVRGLRHLGHEVDDVWSDQLPHRLRHWNLHHALEQPRAYLAVIKERLRRKSYDVILASQPQAYLAARWLRKQAPHIIMINRSHGWEAHVDEVLAPHRRRLGVPRWKFPRGVLGRPLNALLRRHCTWAARACHGVVVSATGCRDYIVRRHGVAPERVAVIPQAAPESYRAHAPQPASARQPGSVLLVSQATFPKGLHDALAIMGMAYATGSRLRFTWVVDPRMHAHLRAHVPAGASHILNLRQPTNQDALRDIYDAHRMFLFPSLFEGFGKAGLEAMARACCVVATDIGGMHDLIRSGESGMLAVPGDCRAMLAHLRMLDEDPDLRERVSANARSRALDFTWEKSTKDLVAFSVRLRGQLANATSQAASRVPRRG